MHEIPGEEDHTLRLYFRDLSGWSPLPREQEVRLAALIQQGDMQARDELVQANLGFVVEIAKEYQHRDLPLCELVSAGNLGLLVAAERFDGTRGFKFISYAVWWIRQAILQTIAEQGRMVRLPINRLALLRGISQAAKRLGQGGERTPDVAEIAAELELSAEEVEYTLATGQKVVSLDTPFGEGDENTLLNILVDTHQESPDAEVLRKSTRSHLQQALRSLSERERRVIRLHFGLEGDEVLTLDQIGAAMGISRERVRQIKELAFKKLRHPTRCPVLRALIDETNPEPKRRSPQGTDRRPR